MSARDTHSRLVLIAQQNRWTSLAVRRVQQNNDNNNNDDYSLLDKPKGILLQSIEHNDDYAHKNNVIAVGRQSSVVSRCIWVRYQFTFGFIFLLLLLLEEGVGRG
uniref:Uncharacterized protein n=1 Tax=Trichogramma kaykai TaxID=54128 RepID=A0ABD2XPY0_9HYME